MSAFTEQQVRAFARDEVRKILDAGLLYTVERGEGTPKATAPNNPSSPKPSTTPPANIIDKFPEELRQHLTTKDSKIYSEYTSKDIWIKINDQAKTLGYEWVSMGKDSHWSKPS